jgi:hypothetical protein
MLGVRPKVRPQLDLPGSDLWSDPTFPAFSRLFSVIIKLGQTKGQTQLDMPGSDLWSDPTFADVY